MRFPKKHLPHVAGHGVLLASILAVGLLTLTFNGKFSGLLAAATSSLSASSATLFFTPYDDTALSVGGIADIDVNINARVPINAIGATIQYPEDTLEVVGFSKKRSFLDLWTEETVIKEDLGEIHFSGGTTAAGGLVGTGTVITISVKAKKPGDATLAFKELQVLARDGKGTELDTYTRVFEYTIGEPPQSAGSSAAADTAVSTPVPQTPSADLDGNGRVTLVDISILTVRMVMPYDPRYDLDSNGFVGLSDLSILFAHMR